MKYPPKDFSNIKLDFSQFHPLDHRPFNDRCRSLYGGGRRHLSLWWDYKAKDSIAAATRCKVGWHKATTWFTGPGHPTPDVMFSACRYCSKRLGPNQPRDQID